MSIKILVKHQLQYNSSMHEQCLLFRLAPPRFYHTGSELAPEDERLLTQQGGCFVFEGTNVLFKHDDSGILKYADVDAVAAAALGAAATPPNPTQVLRSFV